jgi:hypothetical protein
MSKNKGEKLKVPHAPADIQAIEDEVAHISEDLRAIRRIMGEKDLHAVELMTGTFRFYCAEMRQIAKDWMAQVEKQVIVNRVKAVRDRKLREQSDRTKKR